MSIYPYVHTCEMNINVICSCARVYKPMGIYIYTRHIYTYYDAYIYIYIYIYSVSFHNCPRLIPFCIMATKFYNDFMSFLNQRY